MHFTDGMLTVNAIFSIRFLYVQREGRIEIAILGGSDEQIPPTLQPLRLVFPYGRTSHNKYRKWVRNCPGTKRAFQRSLSTSQRLIFFSFRRNEIYLKNYQTECKMKNGILALSHSE